MFLSSFHQQKTLKKLRKLLSKGFERSVYWNEHKTKSENENKTSKYIYFIQSNIIMLKLRIQKLLCSKRCYQNYIVIMNGKTFDNQPINSAIKQYKKEKKN